MVFVLLLKKKKVLFFSPQGRANGIIWSTAQFQLWGRHPHLIFTNESLHLALHDTAGLESSSSGIPDPLFFWPSVETYAALFEYSPK